MKKVLVFSAFLIAVIVLSVHNGVEGMEDKPKKPASSTASAATPAPK
jgi:hypothetical protein